MTIFTIIVLESLMLGGGLFTGNNRPDKGQTGMSVLLPGFFQEEGDSI
jgi:hypothetical protein